MLVKAKVLERCMKCINSEIKADKEYQNHEIR